MKALFTTIIGMLFCIGTIFSQESADDLLEQAIRYKQTGKYTEAVGLLNRYIGEYDESNANVYQHRGYSYYYSEEYELAISDFEKAESLAPGDTDAAYAIGKIYLKWARYSDAIIEFDKELHYHPDNARAYNDRGIAKFNIRKYQEAIDDFTHAFGIDSTFAMAYNNAGAAAYYNQDVDNPIKKDIEVARDYFGNAIKLNPTLALAYRNRAVMQLFLKEYEPALADLKIAGKLKPDDALILFYKGVVLEEMGKPMSAIKILEQACQINPSFPFSFEEIGDIYLQKENYKNALNYYQKALQQSSSKAAIYQGLLHYKIAKVYAKTESKSRMYNHLDIAKKMTAFSDKKVYQSFLQENSFRKYRTERRFKKFTKAVNRVKKEYQFKNSELRWFRVNG